MCSDRAALCTPHHPHTPTTHTHTHTHTHARMHTPPPHTRTHTRTPPTTPATRSPQVCIEKAQLSLARSCPTESDHMHKEPHRKQCPRPFILFTMSPSDRHPSSPFSSCFLFLFVLVSPVYPQHPSSCPRLWGSGLRVFSFDVFASRSQMDAPRVRVCVLHLVLCFGDLCPLFLM
uniref:Uncharacterized protein n=1 Tax=Pipistrellus kuhlii TaxID=59472 RepID=A0A7J7V0I8_PIPKU|nr:hypothetical protein mPipKuh1_008657 [Pipistrellus kuhlii]